LRVPFSPSFPDCCEAHAEAPDRSSPHFFTPCVFLPGPTTSGFTEQLSATDASPLEMTARAVENFSNCTSPMLLALDLFPRRVRSAPKDAMTVRGPSPPEFVPSRTLVHQPWITLSFGVHVPIPVSPFFAIIQSFFLVTALLSSFSNLPCGGYFFHPRAAAPSSPLVT